MTNFKKNYYTMNDEEFIVIYADKNEWAADTNGDPEYSDTCDNDEFIEIIENLYSTAVEITEEEIEDLSSCGIQDWIEERK